ncbi:MAG: hypothetical protein WAN36_11960 [Calditrichia bacterium]
MKKGKKALSGIMSMLLCIMLLGTFYGCDRSPLAPAGLKKSGQPELQFIPLGKDSEINFGKVITASKEVSPDSGGRLELEYIRGESGLTVGMSFEVLPQSIADTSEIAIGLNTGHLGGMVDLSFGPHGLTFDPYALINLKTTGLHLDNINTDSLAFFYVEPSGEWVEMPCDSIVADKESGSIKVCNAKVPHFSRYAIAISRNR